MEVKLPSGGTVHLRDTFKRGDRRRARPGNKVIFGTNGNYTQLPSDDEVIGRILQSVITGWDLPHPVPANAPNDEAAQRILDELDDDDYEVLAEAVRPFFDKVMRSGKAEDEDPNSSSGGTGISGPAKPDGQETLSI